MRKQSDFKIDQVKKTLKKYIYYPYGVFIFINYWDKCDD